MMTEWLIKMFTHKKNRKGMLDDLFDYLFTVFIVFFMLAFIGFMFEFSSSGRMENSRDNIVKVFSDQDNLIIGKRAELISQEQVIVGDLISDLGVLDNPHNQGGSEELGEDLFDFEI